MKKNILGLFLSFLIFALVGFLNLNIGWAFAPIIMAFFATIVFLFLNFTLFFILKFVKAFEVKKGVAWGSLFAIIYLMLGLAVFFVNYPAYYESAERNKAITEGFASSDITGCSKIPDIDAKWVCILRFARDEQNPTYCEEITKSQDAKELCYVEALKNSKDKELIQKYCLIIQNINHKTNCNTLLKN